MMKQILLAAVIAAASLGMTACGRYAVRPDEKEFLADRIMQPDYDSADTAVEQHTLSNREGAQGGYGAGGGGCGCN